MAALLIILLGSAALHELGHVCAARACGWRIDGTFKKWWGLGFRFDMQGRADLLWVAALAGPAVSLLLTALFAGMLAAGGGYLAAIGLAMNALMVIVNLLPVHVSDGAQAWKSLRARREAA